MSCGNGSTSGNHRDSPWAAAGAGAIRTKVAKHRHTGAAPGPIRPVSRLLIRLFEGARNRLLQLGGQFFGWPHEGQVEFVVGDVSRLKFLDELTGLTWG